MSSGLRGRGKQVAEGVWRLQLPLPWTGIPHVNAWALERADGITLVDCGLASPDSLEELERALGALDAGLADVRLLVCTHAHPDHYGQAASVVGRAGCELWMHPRHAHTTAALRDPHAASRLLRAGARLAGVPDSYLPPADTLPMELSGVAGVVLPDRELTDGDEVDGWRVIETPGHAPSHVSLFDGEMLLSGDHLLQRPVLHFDFGFSSDPVGDYLSSLERTEMLDAALCLPGHGPPFHEVAAATASARAEVAQRLERIESALQATPMTAFELASHRHGGRVLGAGGSHFLAEALALLAHLEHRNRVERVRQDGVDQWRIRSSN
jgi:glyoxylase-like metal-dependent hydrolase (beta-lactamase superfamily II)